MDKYKIQMLAIIGMTLNHIGHVFVENEILKIILINSGMITFPIMGYFLIEGFEKTKSYKKYLFRLILGGLVSSYPFYLAFSNIHHGISPYYGSIYNTLTLSLIMIYLMKKLPYLNIIWIFLGSISSIYFDWGIVGPLLIGLYYLVKDKSKLIKVSIPIVITIIIHILLSPTDTINILGMFLAIPILCSYNNQEGIKSRLFYWYYPIHLLVIYFFIQIK